MDSLVHTVMEIADQDTGRSNVWPALLSVASYDGNSVMMPWLVKHFGQGRPLFPSCRKWQDPRGGAGRRADWFG